MDTKQERVDFLKLACEKSTYRRNIQRIKLERLLLKQKRSNVQDCPHCGDSLLVTDGTLTIDDGSSLGWGVIDQIRAVEALIIDLEEAMEQDDIHYQMALDDFNELKGG